jgi:hypothetical protein
MTNLPLRPVVINVTVVMGTWLIQPYSLNADSKERYISESLRSSRAVVYRISFVVREWHLYRMIPEARRMSNSIDTYRLIMVRRAPGVLLGRSSASSEEV